MNTKNLFFNLCFRTCSFFSQNMILKIIGFPFRLLYKFCIQWVLGIDIPDTTKIGKNFTIFHGQGLVVHKSVIIGNNVTLRHNTTIGNARQNGACPIIADNVDVGANSVIIGDIRIGNNAVIAAGSIVVKNVPDFAVVAGNPAKVIKVLK